MTGAVIPAGQICHLRIDEIYGLGLIAEESGEIVQLVGKALRFGVDARGPAGPPSHGSHVRELLPIEVGDILAAIRYLALTGLLDLVDAERCADAKLNKLLDPSSVLADGRRLAPPPGWYA
jgi:hypothetical protein